ncbi:BON domain-containing protein [Apibacter muscae]|uniref:BON domain-containing protein n=1 Tax=Apibacter muscae TaxID=2509004 RepID=UPI0011AC4A84|nr:BON domain-containing protein [Apibacter muscae]TWP24901.1 BON domain-containing protein [Apibacter muscae]
MKKIKTLLASLAIVGMLASTTISCKSGPKDQDIKTQISNILPENISIDVNKGVATLSGEFKDDQSKQETLKAINAIPGVKSVVDNATVKSVEISADATLRTNVDQVLKNYPGVTATINDGVVTLTGEFKKTELPKLLQAVNSLKPKKVENQLTLK